MRFATDPRYAVQAIQQAITEGLGNARTVATGSFANWGAYEGASPSFIGANALVKTQIKIVPGPLTSIFENGVSRKHGYSAKYSVVGYWRLEDPGLFQQDDYKDQIWREMMRDIDIIRKTLCTPRNLETNAAGNMTGLSSGCLRFESSSTPTLDFGGRFGTVTMTFVGNLWTTTARSPELAVAPVISGSNHAGGSALVTSNGSWEGEHPITYAYQWRRAGSNITNATGSVYSIVEADVTYSLDVRVTATNQFGSASGISNAISVEVDGNAMMTEGGDYLISESGDYLITEN
jgi:hypothetical protein